MLETAILTALLTVVFMNISNAIVEYFRTQRIIKQIDRLSKEFDDMNNKNKH
jgi:hypothetical protein